MRGGFFAIGQVLLGVTSSAKGVGAQHLIWVCNLGPGAYCSGVRHLKVIVTVLVLVVWSSCSVRCVIENLNCAAEPPCCNEDGGQSDQAPAAPGQCVCSAIQAGGYVSQQGAFSIPLPVDGMVLFLVAPQQAHRPTRPGSVQPVLSPPGALKPWQFLFRAAVPARAPSLVS